MTEERQSPWAERDEYERKLKRALEIERRIRLPRPGERHNGSAIPVSDTALAALLALAQQGMALAACQVVDCENCNAHRLIWWDCCNALDRSTAISLQAWLNAEGYGLPEAPWEDVEPDGTPHQRGNAGPRA